MHGFLKQLTLSIQKVYSSFFMILMDKNSSPKYILRMFEIQCIINKQNKFMIVLFHFSFVKSEFSNTGEEKTKI